MCYGNRRAYDQHKTCPIAFMETKISIYFIHSSNIQWNDSKNDTHLLLFMLDQIITRFFFQNRQKERAVCFFSRINQCEYVEKKKMNQDISIEHSERKSVNILR